MRQSTLFTKTKRDAPKDEIATNAKLLIRGGYVHKELAGVYTFLPIGLLVHKRIENIIREEMNAIGGQEILMTTLQDPAIWEKSGRWDDKVVDNWFKTELKNGQALGIASTHEEPLVRLLTQFMDSYKDLPLAIYQFQTKFRNELRVKSGLMRTREFVMKDLYSFSRTEEEFRTFYEECARAYKTIFERVGIGDVTYRTIAAGGSFTSGFTDEFQTVSRAGEDTIYIDREKGIAINKEVLNEKTIEKFGLTTETLEEKKSIEVGNIFPLGTKYADALGLFYVDSDGEKNPVVMGSYGIGLGRLMGAVVEVHHDERGIIWPSTIAPFSAHLLALGDSEETVKKAEKLYKILLNATVDVLFDDRQGISAGKKLISADLLGIPERIVVSEKTIAENKVELKERSVGEATLITTDDLIRRLKGTANSK